MRSSANRPQDDPVQPDRSAEDRAAIRRLREGGIDVDRPRDVAHSLWLPDETSSRLVAEAVRTSGRTVVSGPASPRSGCPIVVFVHHELEPDVISTLRAEFQAVAEAVGGAYQGWSLPGHPGPNGEGGR